MLLTLLAGLLTAPVAPDSLQAVTVVADRGVVVSRTDTVSISPALDAAATLLAVPGLYVGDYGHGAGLKSVSLRGLGSAHTAIYVDGFRVGNVQSGQTDLGLLGIENFSSAVVDYAQNSVLFQTARPVFRSRPVAGKVRLHAGSFGTWQPYARTDFRLGGQASLSVNMAGNFTQGDFPLADGSKRVNNDLSLLRGGADLFGLLDGGDYHAKIFANRADRGTPGSLSWPSTDTQSDRNFLAQASMRKQVSDLYQLTLGIKGSLDALAYKSTWGDSDYNQTEFQLNSVHKFRLDPRWTASLAADLQWDGLKGNVYASSRLGTVLAAAAAYRADRFRGDFALEYDGTFGEDGASWNVLSPSADVRLTLAPGVDLVAFGRRAFRVPVFNELYYPGYGNPDLKPEDAWLSDLGVDFRKALGTWTVKVRTDGYFNHLTNKIISAPSEDPMVWLPYNVGKVQAYGADVLLGTDRVCGAWKTAFTARYGYQEALDKTPDSASFGQQIPYVARHSVVLTADAACRGWSLGAIFHSRSGRRGSMGEMPAWQTLDLTFGKECPLRGGVTLGFRFMARNLLDCRYDIISDYPMPGRSFLGGIECTF